MQCYPGSLSRDGQRITDEWQRNWTAEENGVMNGRITLMNDLCARRPLLRTRKGE